VNRPERLTVPVLITLCAATAGVIAMARVRTEHDTRNIELTRLRGQIATVNREIEGLRLEVAQKLAPERLERRARQMGMVYPSPDQIIPSREPGVIPRVRGSERHPRGGASRAAGDPAPRVADSRRAEERP
jgi:cell division protein FtsL